MPIPYTWLADKTLSPAPLRPQGFNFSVKAKPAISPVSVADLKLFGRIDGNAEDSLLSAFIEAATLAAENYLGRALITQTLVLTLDEWPGEILEFPRPPVLSVVEVRTIDRDGTATAYDSGSYYLVQNDQAPRLVVKNGTTYPTNTSRFYGGYEVEYTAGYGPAATDVPAPIREAIRIWAQSIYENREIDPLEPTPEVKPLLWPYRIIPI